jgi:hypothetical protein
MISTQTPSAQDLALMADLLDASSDYRVLRRLQVPTHYQPDDGTSTKTAIFLDVETTGLEAGRNESGHPRHQQNRGLEIRRRIMGKREAHAHHHEVEALISRANILAQDDHDARQENERDGLTAQGCHLLGIGN